VTQYPNRRNPIVRHGEVGQQFVPIPNDLARDTSLSLHAYKIAIVIRTHRQGWEVSGKSFAEEYGWGRNTVMNAFAELVDAGWLAIRKYNNDKGYRLFEEYHVHAARQFTEEEAAIYGNTVSLPTGRVLDEDITLNPFEAEECSDPSHDAVPNGAIKEDQPKQLSEHQSEEHHRSRIQTPQTGGCYPCATSGTGRCERHAVETTSMAEWLSTAVPVPSGPEW
jgi:hypothetical protein